MSDGRHGVRGYPRAAQILAADLCLLPPPLVSLASGRVVDVPTPGCGYPPWLMMFGVLGCGAGHPAVSVGR
jgi:hypothetical protein